MTEAQTKQLDAVLGIASEVERHANAIDPADPTAASVLVELCIDLVSGIRILTKVVREMGGGTSTPRERYTPEGYLIVQEPSISEQVAMGVRP